MKYVKKKTDEEPRFQVSFSFNFTGGEKLSYLVPFVRPFFTRFSVDGSGKVGKEAEGEERREKEVNMIIVYMGGEERNYYVRFFSGNVIAPLMHVGRCV